MDTAEIITGFREFLKSLGYTQSTITGYSLDVHNYMKWLELNPKKKVPAFIKYLKKNEFNPKTINHHIFALQHLQEYLGRIKASKKIPLEGLSLGLLFPVNESSEIDFTTGEIETFINQIKKTGNKRYIALVLLMAKAGLKISEALNLKTENISGTKIMIKNDERKIIRSVRATREISEAINDYLASRKGETTYLFNSNKSKRLDRTVVNRFFQEYGISPKQLRQYFIIRCLIKDMNKADISKKSGIKSYQWILSRYVSLDFVEDEKS
jgi:integrase/recombinase XerD